MKYELLGNIVDISKGKKHNPVEIPCLNSKRIIGIKDLRNDFIIVFTDDNNGVEAYEKDILIAWDGANAGTIGYGKKGYIGSTISRLRIKNTKKYCETFLGKLLQSKFSYLSSTTTGATIPHVNRAALDSIIVPQFDLSDQIRIATVLTGVESLITKRKESIKVLEELLKSTFLEMFGDPRINPKRFPLVELQTLYIDTKNGTKCGPFGSALKKEEFVDNGVPVWNMDNISITGHMVMPFRMWIAPEKYCALKAYSILNGDVIISRAGTVGKMCVAMMVDEKSIISTNLIRVRFGNKLLPLYFVSLMNYCKGRVGRLKTGVDGTFTHMNTGVLDTLTFPYPPIKLQNQFAAIIEKTDALKAKYIQSFTELENLYGTLSQQAFKGELDLSKVPVGKEN